AGLGRSILQSKGSCSRWSVKTPSFGIPSRHDSRPESRDSSRINSKRRETSLSGGLTDLTLRRKSPRNSCQTEHPVFAELTILFSCLLWFPGYSSILGRGNRRCREFSQRPVRVG